MLEETIEGPHGGRTKVQGVLQDAELDAELCRRGVRFQHRVGETQPQRERSTIRWRENPLRGRGDRTEGLHRVAKAV